MLVSRSALVCVFVVSVAAIGCSSAPSDVERLGAKESAAANSTLAWDSAASATTTQIGSMELVDSVDDSSDPERGWGDTSFSFASVFESLPSGLLEPGAPVPNGSAAYAGDSLWITVTDLVAASRLDGLDRPDGGDNVDVETWLLGLRGDDASSSEGRGFGVFLTGFPFGTGSIGESQQFASEFGFGFGEIDALAEISQRLAVFTVLSGNLELGAGFVDDGGRMTLGTGEDYERSVEEVSKWRPYGQPVRAGVRDGLLALSGSSLAVDSWNAGDFERLGDDERFSAVGAALDSVDTVSARILLDDFSISNPLWPRLQEVRPEVDYPITESFDAIAVGTAAPGGEPVSVVAYVFKESAAADTMAPVVRDLWRNGATANGDPYRTMYDDVNVETIGPVVLLTATPINGASTLDPLALVYRTENVAIHSGS